jgi:hypothetical protein
MAEKVTGASDWRSDEEKEKSYLRTASMSLFKTWIPEHPEATAERDQVVGLWRQAMHLRTRVTFVSTLSTGVDDIMVHEYHDLPLSMQELLVQREGTEAFLDPRNALRVVRRKYGMMTLITRMTGTMEHRNIVSISIDREVEPRELAEFARILSARVTDTAAEEEQTFRKAFTRGQFPHIEVLFHADVVGRRIPVPWEVKQAYALAGRAARQPGVDPPSAARRTALAFADRLSAKALKQLALYARDITNELDMPGVDPGQVMLEAAREDRLLTATRSLFDEYQASRRTAMHQRALGQATPATDTLIPDTNFLADAEEAAGPGAEDDMLRTARALDRIRAMRGREFFGRISMVSGDVDFETAARAGQGFEEVERTIATLDPLEGLKAARKIVEPFFRARALAAACATLAALGRSDDAAEGAHETLAAARLCQGGDVGAAFAAALQALLAARLEQEAVKCLQEAIDHAHGIKDLDERVGGLMRVVSTLMEAGPLPVIVKSNLSRHILGKDVHFWGKPNITSALVEAIVSLLPGPDDDTIIFLQKVVSHPKVEVRCSVIRTMPLTDSPALRNVLLSHLKDREPQVRTEVMERIGWAGDRSMNVYLVNHARHAQELASTREEKRSLALNLARLEGERHLAIYNMFLGHLWTEAPGLSDKGKAFKDDPEWQLAALEVLYHLNGRNARRLIFTAAEKAKKRKSPLAEVAARCWSAVKNRPYGEPTLPRSPHDPSWTEEDRFDLEAVLARVVPVPEEPEAAPAAETEKPTEVPSAARPVASTFVPPKEGLFSKLKRRLFGSEDEDEPGASAPSRPGRESEPGDASDAQVEVDPVATAPGEVRTSAPRVPVGPPPAALRFEGCLHDAGTSLTGSTTLAFALYDTEDASKPMWQEAHADVPVRQGNFSVNLGLQARLPSPLPNIVWLGIGVSGQREMTPRTRLTRARSVVQG